MISDTLKVHESLGARAHLHTLADHRSHERFELKCALSHIHNVIKEVCYVPFVHSAPGEHDTDARPSKRGCRLRARLGHDVIMLNSEEVAVELLEECSHNLNYSDRPVFSAANLYVLVPSQRPFALTVTQTNGSTSDGHPFARATTNSVRDVEASIGRPDVLRSTSYHVRAHPAHHTLSKSSQCGAHATYAQILNSYDCKR